MPAPHAATSESPRKSENLRPLGKLIGESVECGIVYMESLQSFWEKIVEICDESELHDEDDEDDEATTQNRWQQKWHKQFFKQLVLFTNTEYDRANIDRDEYLLSLYQVADDVLANTIHIDVDREVFRDPVWLTGRPSPGETRKKLEANLAQIEKLDGLEERSQTQSWYFSILEGSDDFDISKVRKYAEHLAIIWKETHGLWTEMNRRAMETHSEAYKKSAVRAHRAWMAMHVAEEKFNIMFNNLPEELEDGEEKADLLAFSNRKSSEESQISIIKLTENIQRLDEADSKLGYEWTVTVR